MQFSLNLLKFQDIRQEIVKYLNANSEYSVVNGGQFDFSNSNIGHIIDAMAYTSMSMNFNISHIANNIFLDSIETRQNAVSKAKEIGYIPKRPYSAKLSGTLYYKGANFKESDSLIIAPRSPFLGSFANVYTNMNSIVLKYNGNPTQLEGDYVLSEGQFKYFKIQVPSDADTKYFSFTIDNKNIDEENFSLYVIPSSIANDVNNNLTQEPYNLTNLSAYKWERITTFKEILKSNVYYIEEDITKEGIPRIIFGNGIFGNSPSKSDVIVCEYFQTSNVEANGENLISLPPTDKLSTSDIYLYYNITKLSNKENFDISNFDNSYQSIYSKSFGGSGLETLEDIKFNAPRFFSSVGRAATKNDYLYIISKFPGISNVNVVAGNDLFPNKKDELGNIYICVVPYINPLEFPFKNEIYILDEVETDIKIELEKYAIISTKRHFYKPTYLLIDVDSTIEMSKNSTTVQQNNTKLQTQSILENFFKTHFNKLGVPFRESKISINIDSLDEIISSYVDFQYNFIMNNKTVDRLIDGVNNIMYLPIINTKSEFGEITGSTRFIKTNSEVIREKYSYIDWTITDPTNMSFTVGETTNLEHLITTETIDEYNKKLKLLSQYHLSLPISERSIYSVNGLVSPNRTRYIYNNDFTNSPIIEAVFIGNTEFVSFVTHSFVDVLGKKINVSILNSAQTSKTIKFSYIDGVGVNHSFDVATIYINFDTYEIEIGYSDENEKNNLLGYFGLNESFFQYKTKDNNSMPFNLIQTSDKHFSISVRMLSDNSELMVYGKNKLFDINLISNTYTATNNNTNEHLKDFIYEPVANDLNFSKITKNTTIAIVEHSHKSLLINYFKGFVSASLFTELNPQNFQRGDYFIAKEVIEYTYNDGTSTTVYFQPNDVFYVNTINSTNFFIKSEIKKNISGYNENELNSIYNNGDLFKNASGEYYVFDSNYPTNQGFKSCDTKLATQKLDFMQSLPKELKHNTIIKITSESPTTITYANNGDAKFTNLYIPQSVSGVKEWHLTSNMVMDGDMLIYNATDSRWQLLENSNNTISDSNYWENTNIGFNRLPDANLMIGSLNIDLITDLPILPLPYDIYFVNTDMYLSNTDRIKFSNPPIDNILNKGDYVVYLDDEKWKIYDDDYYDYYIDAKNENSAFPIPLSIGDIFEVTTASLDVLSGNFNGKTGTITYTASEKIVYIGNNEWTKLLNDYPLYSSPMQAASLGDMIQININGGNLNNSIKVNSPKYDDGKNQNKIFGYDDVLFFTTDNEYVKIKPVNIYTVANDTTLKTELYDLELNSDFEIENNSNDGSDYSILLKDIFDNSTIATLNYTTGKLLLNPFINISYNKNNLIVNNTPLSKLFVKSNYSERQVDTIRFLPSTINENMTDFDTSFNEYIIANIKDVKVKL